VGNGLLLASLAWTMQAVVLSNPEMTVSQQTTTRAPGHGLLVDVGVAVAGSLAVAALKPDIREALVRDASLSNVLRNFTHSVHQVRVGTRRDTDPFWVNNVAHPGLFALEALYLKRRGHGDGGAFLFTQVHSVVWEFVVEGSAFEPSGKDLIANAAGAAAGLWLLRPVAEDATKRVEEGRGRAWDHALRWLDPVTALSGRPAPPVAMRPLLGRSTLGLQLTASF
jgi:hypothetical protein